MVNLRSALLLGLATALVACAPPGRDDRENPGGAGGNGGAGGGGGGAGTDAAPPDAGKKDSPPVGSWSGEWADPGVGADPAGKFGGASSAAGKPKLVYPLADSLHPTNIADIKFQWQQGASSNTLFRIRLDNSRGSYDFYAPCPGTPPECVLQMPESDWLEVARANPDADVTVTVSGTDGAGGAVATSDPVTIRFSPEPVKGGLYYWSTALKGTYRLVFGAKKALPYIRPGTATNEHECGGCHSVSRNGKMISFTGEAGQGYLRVAPTDAPESPTIDFNPLSGDKHNSATMALSPDGARVLVSWNAELTLYDTSSKASLGNVPSSYLGPTGHGYFPEWSPDGQDIALVIGERNGDGTPGFADYDLATAQVAIMPYNDGGFGPAKVIVPMGGEFHFYPSWSPDGKWIAFASAKVGSKGGGSPYGYDGYDSTYNEPQAHLRLVARDGGKIYELARATQGLGKTSTWPKFTPFVQLGGDMMFIAFNSKMDYGFLLKNSKQPRENWKNPQLWFSAIDLRQLGSGDPSSAPIWLPFQDVKQKNHLPYWTEVIGCQPGATAGGGCGEGEVCRAGACEKE